MIFFLAAVGTFFIFFYNKRAALLMPAWILFTPKALLLLDLPGLPVISLYKYFCAILISGFIFRAIIAPKTIYGQFPYKTAFGVLLGAAFVSVLANAGSSSAGYLTFVTMITDLTVPVFIYCIYASQLDHAALRRLAGIYIGVYCAVAVYAVVCYVSGHNPYIDFIKSTTHTGRVLAQTYEGTLRGLRAQGTVSHPITFGAVLVAMLITYATLRPRQRWEGKFGLVKIAAIWLIIVAGVMLTNSRSPLLMLMIATTLFALWQHPLRTFGHVTAVLIAGVVVLSVFPAAMDRALSVANIFNSDLGKKQYGSSLDMRSRQLEASLKYFNDSPLWGGGLDKSRNIVSSGSGQELYNTESIVFRLIIDQGIIGIISFIVFFLVIFTITIRQVVGHAPKAWVLGLSAGYAAFIISTGIMDTLHYFVLMMALIYFYFYQQRRELAEVDLACKVIAQPGRL